MSKVLCQYWCLLIALLAVIVLVVGNVAPMKKVIDNDADVPVLHRVMVLETEPDPTIFRYERNAHELAMLRDTRKEALPGESKS